LIHGYLNSAVSYINKVVKEAYLRSYDYNVVVVNWGGGAKTPCYDWARDRVEEVGPVVAEMLDFLLGQNAQSWDQLTVVGHSLGAHVAGFTGRNVRNGRVGTIVGLDPAGPLFDENDPAHRLNSDDAVYVECIHTNWKCYGMRQAIGHTDFYANGGYEQPGCNVADSCDHSRSIDLFAESIIANKLRGNQCKSLDDIKKKQTLCCGPIAHFGSEPGNAKNNIRGVFNVVTNGKQPYGDASYYRTPCWT